MIFSQFHQVRRSKMKPKKVSSFLLREFSYQSFSRSFTLPNSADSEKIVAKYENGILRIKIPKKEEAKPRPARQIAIA